ncbi:MAG: exodeoxyribonuclease III [Bacilli bacterium]|nr:exodeoxyribonuclease III [Bacillales bacterium]MDY2574398.1 exodeoxyribonuclease III [Bacilli bacterium]
MKIVSFNVNGIRAILSKDFEKDFYSLDADIFSINETKLNEESFKDVFPFDPLGYFSFWTNSKLRKGYSGVAVFTKKAPISVHYGLEDGKYDEEGRVITLEYENFYYVCCYVPNSGDELKRLDFRLTFEMDILNYLNKLNSKKPVIYAGDLNVAHQEIDLKNPKANENNAGFTIQERNAFTNLLSQGYIDTFRYLNPNEIKYSWWSYRFNARSNNAGWRIDYFVVSERLKDKLISSLIHNEILGSDHCPIELNVDL